MSTSTHVPADVGGLPDQPHQTPARLPRRRRRAWWMAALAFVVTVFLAVFALPPYLTLDPDQARISILRGESLHYATLILHIAGGAVAMVTGCLQVWPWLRRRSPKAHRVAGRVYVASVLVSAPALAALVVYRAIAGDAPTTSVVVGFGMLTILWVWTTAAGFLAARRRDFAEHRRQMIYSFAMTLSIIWSRFAYVVALAIPDADISWIEDNTGWLPWVLNLVIVQWWLNRTGRRGRAARRARRGSRHVTAGTPEYRPM